jgi:hypothetical protein
MLQSGFSEEWLCSIFSNLTEDLLESLRAAWLSVMIIHLHSMQQADNTAYSQYRRKMQQIMQSEVLADTFFWKPPDAEPNLPFSRISLESGTMSWPSSIAAPWLSPGALSAAFTLLNTKIYCQQRSRCNLDAAERNPRIAGQQREGKAECE